MQIVIDIPNRIYKIIQNKTLNIMDAEILEKAVKNGTPLPENATNGDVIKTLFPKCMWNATGQDEEWWNAPYEVESEDKE